MLRASSFSLVGVVVALASVVCGQEVSIEKALRLSKQTGKPIFAIASRKICPPCKVLKSRVAQFFQNSSRADQVVYLRIDLDGQSWKQWSRQFPHKGRMLPLVYLVRPDGRQLYGQSNTLPGEQLGKFIEQALAHCGQSYSTTEIKQLALANESIEEALIANEIDTAIKWVNTVKTFGQPGGIHSFAEEALRNNQLVRQIANQSSPYVKREMAEVIGKLAGDQQIKFEGVCQFVSLEKSLGHFENIGQELSKVSGKLAADEELRTLRSIAGKIYEAQGILDSAMSTPEKVKAISRLKELDKGDVPEVAKLAAREIIQKNDALFAKLNKRATTK